MGLSPLGIIQPFEKSQSRLGSLLKIPESAPTLYMKAKIQRPSLKPVTWFCFSKALSHLEEPRAGSSDKFQMRESFGRSPSTLDFVMLGLATLPVGCVLQPARSAALPGSGQSCLSPPRPQTLCIHTTVWGFMEPLMPPADSQLNLPFASLVFAGARSPVPDVFLQFHVGASVVHSQPGAFLVYTSST